MFPTWRYNYKLTGVLKGLDMITQLLIPKGDTELKNQIEEVGGGEENEETEEFNDIDWYFQQTPNQELNHPHFWFNAKYQVLGLVW